MIKYGVAKQILAKYASTGGKCATDPSVDLFVRQVLQYLLLNGSYGNERKFIFHAVNGVMTLPKELETPLKVRIDGAVGSVWNRWFEYHSGNWVDDNCLADNGVLEEPNLYPTVYDIGSCGAYPAVMGTCEEAEDANVIVKGEDPTGREIFSVHKGEKIVGVYLTVRKNKLTTTDIRFGKITGVSKSITKGYVNLVGLNDYDGLSRTLLADYSPYETDPAYRRIRILAKCPPICKVSILGRIRLKDYYADEDIIPFDNLFLLQVAGQTINSMYNDNVEISIAQSKVAEYLIEKESIYKKVNNGQPVEFYRPLSGGVIKNAARMYGRYFRGWR